MRAKHQNFIRGRFLEKKNAVLLLRSLYAGALNLGICTRQNRPHGGLVLKLNHGVDEQLGFIRPAYSWIGI
jgi:hypothetical protein